MSSQNRLHAFTISPEASDIIGNIRNKKKSKFVTDAIIHFRKWQHTDHTDLKLTEHVGVKDIKDFNLAWEEEVRLRKRWVKRALGFQERIIELENKLSFTDRPNIIIRILNRLLRLKSKGK